MVPVPFILIAIAFIGVSWLGEKTVHGVNKLDHKIATHFRKHPITVNEPLK